jgi:hypothetical protein
MFHACKSAARSWRSFYTIASAMVVASCSSAGGPGTEPADTSNSAAPVLRAANGQQVFGSASADSSSGNAAPSPGSAPVGSAPGESGEAQKDPVLVSPDAGAVRPPPAAPQPPSSAAPQPSDTPSAASDDDDDDDDEADDDEADDDD